MVVQHGPVRTDAPPGPARPRGGVEGHAGRAQGGAVGAAGVGPRRGHNHHPAGALALGHVGAAGACGRKK